MKKLIKIFLVLFIFVCGICIVFYIKNEKEELEVINKDVRLSNIKSILDIETETSDSEIEIPLGCKDNKIYILKYDNTNKKYDNNIYALNENGEALSTDIEIPEVYLSSENINVYGDKIFNNYEYFDWNTGTEVELVSNAYEKSENNDSYCINGNSEFILLKNDDEYSLCNIKTNEKYTYVCTDDSKNIKSISFNKKGEEFYVLDKSNCIDKVIIENKTFRLEKYDELKLQDDLTIDNYNNYFLCSNNYFYLGNGIVNNEINFDSDKKGFNIGQYNIDYKNMEYLNNITICGYDKYYGDYVLVKKNDNENNNKISLAKLCDDRFDLLMEIERKYDADSMFSIHMFDAQNVLIKETHYDKENKTIKSKYSVYDLTDYFTQNDYVLNNDGTWSNSEENNSVLKNTLKNIDESEQAIKEPTKKENENTALKKTEENNSNEIKQAETVKENNKQTDKQYDKNEYIKNDFKWTNKQGDWYYYNNEENKKITGWLKLNDSWFYFDSNGVMQTNAIIELSDGEYEVGSDGKVVNFIPNENKNLINSIEDSKSLDTQNKNLDIDKNLNKYEPHIKDDVKVEKENTSKNENNKTTENKQKEEVIDKGESNSEKKIDTDNNKDQDKNENKDKNEEKDKDKNDDDKNKSELKAEGDKEKK